MEQLTKFLDAKAALEAFDVAMEADPRADLAREASQ